MIFRLFLKGEFWRFMGKNHPRIRVALKVRLFYAIFISNGSQKMTMESRKNQLKQAEMQGNKAQIVQGETGSRKMTMKSKKQIQNQAQEGRSMVEMLGVLAIIGVLSLGGIVGYKLAMNYYQANQIVHELNMMRTDAQIKIAQGAENLTLGSPYDDEHKINFNGYGTTFDCALADEEKVILDDVSCYAANAYYIELQDIPEGVCKPLARLINGMDNLIAFYINDNSVDAAEEEKGTCGEGNNTLTVVFGADSVSNAIRCGGTEDSSCPDNLPVCFEHVCVECTANTDCGDDTPYCDTDNDNTCKSCYEAFGKDKPYWNGSQCVECPDATKWDRETNACEYLECPNGTNAECTQELGDGYFCVSSDCAASATEICTSYKCASIGTPKVMWFSSYNVTYYYNDFPANGGINWGSPVSGGVNWWSAVRYCQALKKSMVSFAEFGCKNELNTLGCENSALRQTGIYVGWIANIWTSTPYPYNSAYVYFISLLNGYSTINLRSRGGYPMCR